MVAKYLNPILSMLITNEYTVKKFFDCAKKVVNYDHSLYMASLDVPFIFTSNNLEGTIENSVNDLFSNIFYSGKLARKDLYDTIKPEKIESI